jgi:hypothetical protein
VELLWLLLPNNFGGTRVVLAKYLEYQGDKFVSSNLFHMSVFAHINFVTHKTTESREAKV